MNVLQGEEGCMLNCEVGCLAACSIVDNVTSSQRERRAIKENVGYR